MADLNVFEIEPTEIHIVPESIATLIGADPQEIPEPYCQIINEELTRIPDYKDVRGGYNVYENIQLRNNTLIIKDVEFKVGHQVFQYIKQSHLVALFVCTAGETVGNRAKKLMDRGDVLEGYIVDVIGSTMVERAMDIVQRHLNAEMAKTGLRTTNRYSPGYCEWNVEDQHKLFSFFPKGFCGVHLLENAMMHPVKSVSGTIGIGKNVQYNKYVCEACTSVNCIYRNIRHAV